MLCCAGAFQLTGISSTMSTICGTTIYKWAIVNNNTKNAESSRKDNFANAVVIFVRCLHTIFGTSIQHSIWYYAIHVFKFFYDTIVWLWVAICAKHNQFSIQNTRVGFYMYFFATQSACWSFFLIQHLLINTS